VQLSQSGGGDFHSRVRAPDIVAANGQLGAGSFVIRDQALPTIGIRFGQRDQFLGTLLNVVGNRSLLIRTH
jgi:hypothetical protein